MQMLQKKQKSKSKSKSKKKSKSNASVKVKVKVKQYAYEMARLVLDGDDEVTFLIDDALVGAGLVRPAIRVAESVRGMLATRVTAHEFERIDAYLTRIRHSHRVRTYRVSDPKATWRNLDKCLSRTWWPPHTRRRLMWLTSSGILQSYREPSDSDSDSDTDNDTDDDDDTDDGDGIDGDGIDGGDGKMSKTTTTVPKTKTNKKRKRKHGAVALAEIRALQKSTSTVVPKAPFQRVVRHIVSKSKSKSKSNADSSGSRRSSKRQCRRVERVSSSAVDALQASAESMLTGAFTSADDVAAASGRATVLPRDLALVNLIGRRW
jgi:histone H3/H4